MKFTNTHYEIEIRDPDNTWRNKPDRFDTSEQAEYRAMVWGGDTWRRYCRVVKVDVITEVVRTIQDQL